MAHLDRFLAALVNKRGSSLSMTAEDVALLEVEGTRHPITTKPIPGAQLAAMLREIAPPDALKQLDSAGGASFDYRSVDGAFRARASTANARLHVEFTPERTNGHHPPASPANGAARLPGAEASASAPARPVAPAVTAAATATPAPVSANGAPVDPVARGEIERLLLMLAQRKASDLHLRVGEPPILRIDGDMVRLTEERALDNDRVEAMLAAIMPDQNRRQFAELNDTDFPYEITGVARYRGNAMRERRGAAAVFRVIPRHIVTAEELGLSAEVQRLCQLSKGLVLVTGATGSGKTTTLCGLIDLINRTRSDHVITIEDPIEFVHENKKCVLTQRQVGPHTSSFRHALRAALREDPDVVLVGELRDLETVAMAIETAETGHLVFGTVHTTTAASTIDRIIDQFSADRQEQVRVMLSESLKGVISQTLCKKIGGGRIAAREVLLAIPAISNLIREGKTFQIPSILQTSRKLGMVTLNDALMELVDHERVEPSEAYFKAVDKQAIAGMLRHRGHDMSFLEIADPSAARPEPQARAGAKPGPGR